jgi:hypothetical protein
MKIPPRSEKTSLVRLYIYRAKKKKEISLEEFTFDWYGTLLTSPSAAQCIHVHIYYNRAAMDILTPTAQQWIFSLHIVRVFASKLQDFVLVL